jgi:hypothetical protein
MLRILSEPDFWPRVEVVCLSDNGAARRGEKISV